MSIEYIYIKRITMKKRVLITEEQLKLIVKKKKRVLVNEEQLKLIVKNIKKG